MNRDRIAAIALIALSVGIFVIGARIPAASLGQGPGPGAFPMFLAAVLGGLSCALIFTAGKKKKKEEPKEASMAEAELQKIDEPASEKWRRILTCTALLFVYFLLLPYLGFIVSTALFGMGFLMLLYKMSLRASIVPAVVVTAFGFVLFELALSVPLPAFMEAIR